MLFKFIYAYICFISFLEWTSEMFPQNSKFFETLWFWSQMKCGLKSNRQLCFL